MIKNKNINILLLAFITLTGCSSNSLKHTNKTYMQQRKSDLEAIKHSQYIKDITNIKNDNKYIYGEGRNECKSKAADIARNALVDQYQVNINSESNISTIETIVQTLDKEVIDLKETSAINNTKSSKGIVINPKWFSIKKGELFYSFCYKLREEYINEQNKNREYSYNYYLEASRNIQQKHFDLALKNLDYAQILLNSLFEPSVKYKDILLSTEIPQLRQQIINNLNIEIIDVNKQLNKFKIKLKIDKETAINLKFTYWDGSKFIKQQSVDSISTIIMQAPLNNISLKLDYTFSETYPQIPMIQEINNELEKKNIISKLDNFKKFHIPNLINKMNQISNFHIKNFERDKSWYYWQSLAEGTNKIDAISFDYIVCGGFNEIDEYNSYIYDGNQWHTFLLEHAVNQFKIIDINNIWAISKECVERFDGYSWNREQNLPGGYSIDSYKNNNNNILVIGERNRIFYYDSNNWQTYNLPNSGNIFKIQIISPNTIWAFSENGAFKFDGNNWHRVDSEKYDTGLCISDNSFLRTAEYSRLYLFENKWKELNKNINEIKKIGKYIWLLSNDSIYSYQNDRFKSFNIPSNNNIVNFRDFVMIDDESGLLVDLDGSVYKYSSRQNSDQTSKYTQVFFERNTKLSKLNYKELENTNTTNNINIKDEKIVKIISSFPELYFDADKPIKNIKKEENSYLINLNEKTKELQIYINSFFPLTLNIEQDKKNSDLNFEIFKDKQKDMLLEIDSGFYSREVNTKTGPFSSYIEIDKFNIMRDNIKKYEWATIFPTKKDIRANQPITDISFNEIILFSNRKSISEGLKPVYSINGSTKPDDWGKLPIMYQEEWENVTCDWTANGYRLPTEAELEYYYSSTKTTSKTNEWCWDLYDENFYINPTLYNPIGPERGKFRVVTKVFDQNTERKGVYSFVKDAGVRLVRKK